MDDFLAGAKIQNSDYRGDTIKSAVVIVIWNVPPLGVVVVGTHGGFMDVVVGFVVVVGSDGGFMDVVVRGVVLSSPRHNK